MIVDAADVVDTKYLVSGPGTTPVRVNTHSFQAPAFYARLGYSEIGIAEDTPVGHREMFLEKRLASRTA
jgi:hypothetical protein